MAMINIGGSEDPAYRYKMPKVTVKIEGRGNGIRTVITNMSQIATALRRDPALPTKFLGCELGAQSKYNADTDKATVNGPHDASTLQGLINGFIAKFVLCPKCSLPETDLIVKPKSGTIMHKCAACGHKGSVDMMHKLVTFILKESKDKSASSKGGTKPRARSGKEKPGKPQESDEEEEAAEAVPSEVAPAPAPDAAAAAGGAAVPGGDEDSGSESDSGEEDTGYVVPTSSAVVVDDTSALESAVDALKSFLEGNKDAAGIAQHVRQLQTNSALPLEDRVRLYYMAAFDKTVMAQSGDKSKLAPLLSIISSMDADARKLLSFKLALLECVEEHVGSRLPALLPVTPVVIKNLYDNDVLDEDSIIEWYNKPCEEGSVGQTVRSRALPFVSWLKDAEEEEAEDE